MATHPSPASFDERPQHAEVPLRFTATDFGKYLEQARDVAGLTQEALVEKINEIIALKNRDLPTKKKIPLMNKRIYGNLERHERYPTYEEFEPIYQALSELLLVPFSSEESERYVTLAQARFAQRKRRPKQGYVPTSSDWQDLPRKLTAFDQRRGGEQKGKVPYLFPVPSATPPTQIRLSAKVVSLLNIDTRYVIERDRYVENTIQWWGEGKRLIISRAIAGTGKTRAFYLLLKRISRAQNHWPFYYLLSPGNQTPDDHLDSLLSLLSTDLQLPSPEDEHITREERMEQIFTELIRCSKQELRIAILVDDAHLLLDPSSGTLSAPWQHFLDQWIAREHNGVLCLATREWPHWKGRDRSFIKEFDLEPLSPAAGATVWKRFGFDDVPDKLLEEASSKCGGYPQWIELRASDLDQPGHQYLWPRAGSEVGHYTSESADNQHTRRIKDWLQEETIFDMFTDVGAREELAQVFTRELSYWGQQVLDLLTASPLGVPFPLLQQEFDHPELALDELMRRSLLDRDSFKQGRAALVSLAREARLHQFSKELREQIEQRVSDLYASWLYDLQQYQDDTEQAALTAELVVLYIKRQQYLHAGELLVTYGWLCAQLGHMSRIERYASAVRPLSFSSPEEEDGRALLHYRIMSLIGKKVNAKDRYYAYKNIYMQVQAGKMSLQPHAEIHIVHEILVPEIQSARYEQGLLLLDEALDRIVQSHQISAEVRASWNQSKARLLARWSEAEGRNGNHEKALALKKECVQIINETIELWEKCLSFASPLYKKLLEYKLGRSYNDSAFRQRLLGNIDAAYDAIQKCLELKRDKKAARPRSLAVAHGEHAQILAVQGELLQADAENAQALSIQQDLLQKGDTSVATDIGMLLVERGNILMQQARTVEAGPLFKEGIRLIGDSDSRRAFRDDAEKQIHIIDTTSHYRLDAQWAERYFQLASYDDIDWVSPAGPFSDEEWYEWETLLARRQEENVKVQMDAILLQSRQRELQQCFVEQREPCFHYPTIAIEVVQQHIAGFERLLTEITTQEQHAIVQRHYQARIQEHLSLLQLYKAIYKKDGASAWEYNQHLYGIPNVPEMTIALRPFVDMLLRARADSKVSSLAEQLLEQIRTWGLSPEDFQHQSKEPEQERRKKQSSTARELEKKTVSPELAQRFFEDVLYSFYHFHDWRVRIMPTRDMAHVESHLRLFILPNQQVSVKKLRELLAEEIETHIYRAMTGSTSPFMLLGSGTAGYRETEEALAIHAKTGEQEFQKKSWLGTLATGLMAGIISPPLPFSALETFLEKSFLIRNIMSDRYETHTEAAKAAREDALERAVRTVRGVPDLTLPGTCCLLDRGYLKGYLDLSDFLREGGDTQHLLVGKIGIKDLQDMEQIHLLIPTIPQQHLAENLDIYAHIRKIEGHCRY